MDSEGPFSIQHACITCMCYNNYMNKQLVVSRGICIDEMDCVKQTAELLLSGEAHAIRLSFNFGHKDWTAIKHLKIKDHRDCCQYALISGSSVVVVTLDSGMPIGSCGYARFDRSAISADVLAQADVTLEEVFRPHLRRIEADLWKGDGI